MLGHANRSWNVDRFHLELQPFHRQPQSVYAAKSALQDGADFKVTYRRQGTHRSNLGLLQLILPHYKLFEHTELGVWNVDKHWPWRDRSVPRPKTLRDAIFGSAGAVMGEGNANYAGQSVHTHAPNECTLIDTPREQMSFVAGKLRAPAATRFAQYVVELDGAEGRVFDQGIIWGYEFEQDSRNTFAPSITDPQPCRLSRTIEHVQAIGRFLSKQNGEVKRLIS